MFGQKLMKEQFKLFLIEIWLFILLILLVMLVEILLPQSLVRITLWILFLLCFVIMFKINISRKRCLNKIAIEEDEEERNKYARPKQPWER